jgi:glycosyltransferase involved in cell wall biosynthesis
MKILQICPKLNQGGVERGTIELANFLTSKNIENHICSNGGILTEQLKDTQHFTLSVNKKDPVSLIINTFKLAKYLKQNQIDIVHARSRAPAWVAFLACKLTNTTYVTTYHGAYSYENIFKKAYSCPMRAGKKVAVISEYIRQHLKDIYKIDENKLVTAYRCFDDTTFNLNNIDANELLDLKTKYHLKNDDVILCLVGRFSKIKGQIELIKALANVKATNWKLLLVGSGNEEITLKIENLIKEYSLEDKIILTGNQINPELFYAASDICFSVRITPEAFGRTPLEAQALEKIVIATNQGGHLETIINNETGFFVEYNNLNNWTQVIENAITLPKAKRLEMGKKAKEWVSAKYTLEKMCQAELDMYKQALDK